MKRRHCVNCGIYAHLLCWECGRMIVATVVGELLAGAIVGGVVWLMK